jgi:hypothetical protein
MIIQANIIHSVEMEIDDKYNAYDWSLPYCEWTADQKKASDEIFDICCEKQENKEYKLMDIDLEDICSENGDLI